MKNRTWALGPLVIAAAAGGFAATGCVELESRLSDDPLQIGQSESPLQIGSFDWGVEQEAALGFAAYQLFGIKAPIGHSERKKSEAGRSRGRG